jgi:hypothetical protein
MAEQAQSAELSVEEKLAAIAAAMGGAVPVAPAKAFACPVDPAEREACLGCQ